MWKIFRLSRGKNSQNISMLFDVMHPVCNHVKVFWVTDAETISLTEYLSLCCTYFGLKVIGSHVARICPEVRLKISVGFEPGSFLFWVNVLSFSVKNFENSQVIYMSHIKGIIWHWSNGAKQCHIIEKHIAMIFLIVASKHTLNFHPSSLYIVQQEIFK